MYKQSPLYLKTNTNSSDRKVQIAAGKKMQIAAENKWFSAQTNANCSWKKYKLQLEKMQIAAENKYDFHLKTNAKSNCPVLVWS